MTIHELLPRLEGVRRSGNGWVGRCPAHDDRSPSLSVGEGSDGRLLLYCHAGCDFLDILAAVGVSDQSSNKPTRARFVRSLEKKKDERRWRTLHDAMQGVSLPPGYKLSVWYFHTPGYARARYEKPSENGDKPEKIFKPFWEVKPGQWANFAPPAPRPLFRVADILARPHETVHYAEGEKCAHALTVSYSVIATTAGGHSSDSTTDYTPLAGRDVVIWPDADVVGLKHAERVATILRRLKSDVRIMPIPEGEMGTGSDVVDWNNLRLYYDPIELAREVFANAQLA